MKGEGGCMNAQYQYCPKDEVVCCYCFKFGEELVCCFGTSFDKKRREDYKLVKDLRKCPARNK
jgi:hypothetical protein